MDADERARLRAAYAKWQASDGTAEDLHDFCDECLPDVVLALLDAADRAEAAEREAGKLKAAWDSAFQQAMENGGKYHEERARAERLEAALRGLIGDPESVLTFEGRLEAHAFFSMDAVNEARAALADPAPAERAADK